MYNTVIFDFDGTVMNTNDVILGSWQHTFRTLEGKERPEEEIIKTLGEPLRVTMTRLFPHMEAEKAIEVYRSYHRDNFGKRITVFPGVRELLQALKERGIKTGLVTSRLRNTTMEGLEKYELLPYFDQVVTCDDTEKHKPDPAPLLLALERLGSKAEESLMVGDTEFDCLCAKNAGVAFVLVGWYLAFDADSMGRDKAPEYYIEEAADLLGIL